MEDSRTRPSSTLGENVENTEEKRLNALIAIAARERNLDLLPKLIAEGADLSSDAGRRAIGLAARFGPTETFQKAVDAAILAGAKIDGQLTRDIVLSSCMTTNIDKLRACKQFIESSTGLWNPDSMELPGGATPLQASCRFDFASGIKALLEWGADPGKTDKNSNNALHIAANHSQTANVETILATGKTQLAAARNADGHTALMLAVKTGSSGCIKALAGCTPLDIQDAQGFTALMLAARTMGASRETIELLAFKAQPCSGGLRRLLDAARAQGFCIATKNKEGAEALQQYIEAAAERSDLWSAASPEELPGQTPTPPSMRL